MEVPDLIERMGRGGGRTWATSCEEAVGSYKLHDGTCIFVDRYIRGIAILPAPCHRFLDSTFYKRES